MMIEGSGAGSGSKPLTSGSGSGRPKNMWIRRIRIRILNTGRNAFNIREASNNRNTGNSRISREPTAERTLVTTGSTGDSETLEYYANGRRDACYSRDAINIMEASNNRNTINSRISREPAVERTSVTTGPTGASETTGILWTPTAGGTLATAEMLLTSGKPATTGTRTTAGSSGSQQQKEHR
jgi:hypothetical protein